jgi:hypothetical protein
LALRAIPDRRGTTRSSTSYNPLGKKCVRDGARILVQELGEDLFLEFSRILSGPDYSSLTGIEPDYPYISICSAAGKGEREKLASTVCDLATDAEAEEKDCFRRVMETLGLALSEAPVCAVQGQAPRPGGKVRPKKST